MSALHNNWKRFTIGELCELINGRAFRPSDWTEKGLPIVRIQNLNNPDAPFNRFDGEVRSRFLIDNGALLFAWSGTPGTSFGAHIWSGGRAILNQHIFNVLFDDGVVDKHFLRVAINQKLDELIDKAHGGVGLRHVTKGRFEETEIFLPSLDEQRRIVARLNDLMRQSEQAGKELDHVPTLITRYKRAILEKAYCGRLTADWRLEHFEGTNAMFEDGPSRLTKTKLRLTEKKSDSFKPPFEIPPKWQWLCLPDLGVLDRGRSRHRPRGHPSLYGGRYPFIQTGDVKAAEGYLTAFTQTYSETGLAQSRLWPAGTLCITIAANIAETAILGIDACFPDSIVGFTADKSLCDPRFVEFFLRTVRADLAAFAPATAQKNINLETLRTVHVPCPPLTEQAEIVCRIDRSFAAIDRAERDAEQAGELLHRLDEAIFAKALRGELLSHSELTLPQVAMVAE